MPGPCATACLPALLASMEAAGHTGAARVLETSWQWQPTWPVMALIAALLCAWLLTAVIYRSPRIELGTGWRVALGLLRAVALAVPVFMLAQPHQIVRLERLEPRTLAVLLDRSGSMSLRDDPQAGGASRWQQAVTQLAPIMASLTGSPPASRPRVSIHLFDRNIEPASTGVPAKPPPLQGRTAIGDALHQLRSELHARPTAGVLIVSDGADNASSPEHPPLAVARDLARAAISVHACLVGSERPRNAAVSAVAESPFAFADDPVPLRVSIAHQGLDDQVARLTVSDGQRVVQAADVTLPPAGRTAVVFVEVTPDAPGPRRYRVDVAPLPGELITADNQAIVPVTVVDRPLRVLYVERWPRWQYRFLRDAMSRDQRFDPTVVLLTEDTAVPPGERPASSLPATADELSLFDVVVLGDLAPQDLSQQQWKGLVDHVVEDGAGVALIAGTQHMPASFVDSPLSPLLPFDYAFAPAEQGVAPFTPVLTPLGRHHPLMRLGFGDDPQAGWSTLPPLTWHAETGRVKPGAMVLAESPGPTAGETAPLVVLQRVGRGAVLFVGSDETWKWRYQVGNRWFYGFWAQAIQHVGMPHLVGEISPVRPEPPELAVNPELADPAADARLLRGIAELTGGQFVTLDELPALIARLDLSPLPYRWSERIWWWDTWTMLLVLAGLLTAEWIIRKRCCLP